MSTHPSPLQIPPANDGQPAPQLLQPDQTQVQGQQVSAWDYMYQALGSLADSVANLVAAVSGYQPALAQASEALAQSAAASTQVSEALAQRADKPKTKPDPPETYDGKPEDAQAFLDACVLYFKHIGEADELRQISYALSKIKGGTNGMASAWANSQRAEIIADTLAYDDWKGFAKAFLAHFQVQNSRAEAILAIQTIEMGDRSCEAYNTEFRSYMTRSGYNEVALIEEYKRGLNGRLLDKCHDQENLPTTLAGWMERAANLDRQYRIRKREKARFKTEKPAPKATSAPPPRPFFPSFRPAAQSTPTPPPPRPADPNAMDIDAHRRQGLCFTCHQKGHISRDCPNKTQKFNTRTIDIRALTEDERAALKKQLEDFYTDRE